MPEGGFSMKRAFLRWNVWTVIALVLAALFISACTQSANPSAPTVAATESAPPTFPPTFTATETGTQPGETPVAPGQTVVAPTTIVTNPPPVATTVAPPQATTPAAQPTTPVPTATTPAGGTPVPGGVIEYTVQAGDNLFRIALKYNLSWIYLAQYNGITTPHAIYAGQVIKIPVPGATPAPGATPVPSSKTYTVKAGDNLFRIALAYNMSYITLAQYNGIPYPYIIYVGQVINIP
jgi:LysM repeat protein